MDLDAVKTGLLSKRDELSLRLERLNRHIHHREEPLPADFAEQAVEQENLEVMHAIDNEAKFELAQVEKALRRLERGEYLQCSACGVDIAPERLKALPYADTCINCAS